MCIPQTAKKLVEYYSKLRELGHPDYLGAMVMHNLQCSSTQDEADEMVMFCSILISSVKFMCSVQFVLCMQCKHVREQSFFTKFL